MQTIIWLTRPFPVARTLLAATVALAAVTAILAIAAIGHRPAPAPNRSAATAQVPAASMAAAADDSAMARFARSAEELAALDRRFAVALADKERGDHAEAFAALAMLADQGHCEAARLGLQMINAGPEVYLISFRAGPKQIARWRRLPRCWPDAANR